MPGKSWAEQPLHDVLSFVAIAVSATAVGTLVFAAAGGVPMALVFLAAVSFASFVRGTLSGLLGRWSDVRTVGHGFLSIVTAVAWFALFFLGA